MKLTTYLIAILAMGAVSASAQGVINADNNANGASAPATPKAVWTADNSADPNGAGSPIKVLPEPSTIALCAVGAAGLLLARRRKK